MQLSLLARGLAPGSADEHCSGFQPVLSTGPDSLLQASLWLLLSPL